MGQKVFIATENLIVRSNNTQLEVLTLSRPFFKIFFTIFRRDFFATIFDIVAANTQTWERFKFVQTRKVLNKCNSNFNLTLNLNLKD